MAQFFIDRPIFAWVIAIFISIAGIVGIQNLPVSQYPSVAAPTINLTATYPGSSAQVMEDSVLAVIERNMNGLEGLDYMTTSADSSGRGSVSLTFTPETNEDMAQVNVQNKLSEVTSALPSIVQQNGVRVTKSRSNFLLMLTFTSDTMGTEAVADYLERNVRSELQRVPGVGEARLFGAERAMRVWLDPQKLKSYDLSIAEVNAAISGQNMQISAGSVGALPAVPGQAMEATIIAQGQVSTPEEFGELVLRSRRDGANVYLKDVARIEIGAQSYTASARLNGNPSTGMAIMLSNKGNALATATAVKAKVRELERFFPQGLKWASPYDTSLFVGLSINEVVHTLFEAMVLVFIVMLVFLQNIRYTLIPAVVVPISLLGAFAGIWYLGMSINVLTMFAMVLVIGIVVDDAIVVVENVERIMDEEGLPPREATKKAMGQISGAVVGITAVLVSVFIPLAMFSGATGNIYRQFALTMAIAIAFSAFFALSLTPALCATLLKPEAEMQREAAESRFWRVWPLRLVPLFFEWFNVAFKRTTRSYQGTVARTMRHMGWLILGYVALTAVALWLYMRIPTSFLPNEDQGALLVMAQLPPGATKERTDATMTIANGVIKSMSEVENFVNVSGFSFAGSGQNMAMGFITLKDWAERHGKGQDAASLAGRITGALMATVKDGFALAINPPAIPELGISAGFSFYLQDRDDRGHANLVAKRNELIGKMRQNPIFDASNVRASGLEDAPQLRIDIDRRTAAAQGISFASISNTLGVALGSAYVSDFPNQGRLQRVIVQADAHTRMQPEDILAMTVPNSQGTGVPLSTVASAQWVVGTQQSVRVNGYPSLQIDGQAATGYSSGEAMAEVLRLVDELGSGYSVEWSGQSREEIKGSAKTTILYAFAILSVFLALAALYESWSIPLAVMLVVPLGFFGMVLGVNGRNLFDGLLYKLPPGYLNDIYFHVGMITVIGLSAKNAILIIEFAKDAQERGKTVLQAAIQAAQLRFRPILMTSFAFILGVVPLYFANGASSASQRAIGTTVFWGMLIGTLLSVFMVPMFYVVVRMFFKGKTSPAVTKEVAA